VEQVRATVGDQVVDGHHLGCPWHKQRGVHIRTVVDLTTEFTQITGEEEQATH
jgi:hypothetical protein